MSVVTFTAWTLPIGQPRQEHGARMIAGKPRSYNYVDAHHPVHAFKRFIREACEDVWAGPPWTGPIGLHVLAIFRRPKRLVWKRRPMPPEWHTAKPDEDNVSKAIKDALTGLAWKDDAQVARSLVEKWIATGDGPLAFQTWVRVTITKLSPLHSQEHP